MRSMNQKRVILEGPDGAGKTTLKRELLINQMRGAAGIHNGLYPKHSGKDLLFLYAKQIMDEYVVLDRSFLSEFTYGNVMRSKDRLGDLGRRLLTRLCTAKGVTQVISLPRFDRVVISWEEKRKCKWDPEKGKGEYIQEKDKLWRVYKLYEWLLKTYPYLYQKHDYDQKGLVTVPSYPPVLPDGCLGYPGARFLFVGEQVNVRKALFDLPFFNLTGVSAYLDEAIQAAGLRETDIAFANAVPISIELITSVRTRLRSIEEVNLHEVKKSMPNFAIAIALGDTAARVCHNQGVPYYQIPHPSYWKRFHSKEFRKYVNLIKGVTHDSSWQQLLRRLDRVA